MPEWMMRAILGAGIIGVLTGATWAFKALQGAPQAGVVKGSPYAAGGGILALLGALGFGLVGVLFSDLSDPDQFWPWLGVVSAFALGGAALLFFYTGVLARFDAAGLQIRTWRRHWRHVPWRDVRRVRMDFSGSGVVIELQSGAKPSLPQDANGLGDLLESAWTARVPGAAELLGRDDAA